MSESRSMGRRLLIRTNENPYHVVCRSNNSEWFSIPLHDIWNIALSVLSQTQGLHPVDLKGFVLMNNHYHMLLYTPDANLDLFMYEFNKRFSLRLRFATSRENRMFGGRYKWTLIKEESHYWNVLRYIFQNPLRAGLTEKCEDYHFSTFHYQYYGKKFVISGLDDWENKEQLKEWFNIKPDSAHNILVKNALFRTTFQVPKASPRRALSLPYPKHLI